MLRTFFKASLVIFFSSISYVLFGQNVGINTTATIPSVNAFLDLNTGNNRNMGLIIPCVNLGTSLTYFQSPNGPMPGNPTAKDNGMIVYNIGTSQPVGYYYWNNNALPNPTWVSTGGGPIGAAINACGGATAGYIPYYTSPSNVCNSVIYQASTTTVGIGTTNPQNMLDVSGAMAVGSYAGTFTAPANGMVISGQVGIGTNTVPASAQLDVNSTTQGLLPPNMTNVQMLAIPNPANGLIVYNTTTNCLEYYQAGQWVNISCPCGTILVDNAVTATQNTSVVNITTAYPNEIIIVMVNGYNTTNTSFTGATPVVTGGSASAVTPLINTKKSSTYYVGTVNTAIYGFVAATAASYTITVSETGNTIYNNSAVALHGFCSTATIAANVVTPTVIGYGAAAANTFASTLTNSTENAPVAKSYVLANYYSVNANIPPDVDSWLAPAGAIPIITDNNTTLIDGSIAGYADAATGFVTYTVQDLYAGIAGDANMLAANLQVVDVHN